MVTYCYLNDYQNHVGNSIPLWMVEKCMKSDILPKSYPVQLYMYSPQFDWIATDTTLCKNFVSPLCCYIHRRNLNTNRHSKLKPQRDATRTKRVCTCANWVWEVALATYRQTAETAWPHTHFSLIPYICRLCPSLLHSQLLFVTQQRASLTTANQLFGYHSSRFACPFVTVQRHTVRIHTHIYDTGARRSRAHTTYIHPHIANSFMRPSKANNAQYIQHIHCIYGIEFMYTQYSIQYWNGTVRLQVYSSTFQCTCNCWGWPAAHRDGHTYCRPTWNRESIFSSGCAL